MSLMKKLDKMHSQISQQTTKNTTTNAYQVFQQLNQERLADPSQTFQKPAVIPNCTIEKQDIIDHGAFKSEKMDLKTLQQRRCSRSTANWKRAFLTGRIAGVLSSQLQNLRQHPVNAVKEVSDGAPPGDTSVKLALPGDASSKLAPNAPSNVSVCHATLPSHSASKRFSSIRLSCTGSRLAELRSKLAPPKLKQIPDENLPKKPPPIEVFRRVARLVRMLCVVCLAIRRYAIDAGVLDNYQVNVTRKTKVGEGEKETEEEVRFNLKDFKLRKELAVPLQVQWLFDKEPQDRTAKDVEIIGRLMRGLPSFRKYTREMQDLFCKIVRYMRCGRRRVVLRKGHIGYNLYFIYSGAVSVVLDKDDGNVFVKPEVVMLKKGACFGEIALVQNTKRNATIVTAQDTEFVYIDKEDFLENKLDIRVQQEFNFRYGFFRRWEYLEAWNDEQIRNISYVSRMEEFNHNKVVVRDSRKNEWLWFVVKGSCDVLRLVDLDKCQSYQHCVLLGSEAHKFITGSSSSASANRLSRAQSARPRLQSKPTSAALRAKESAILQSEDGDISESVSDSDTPQREITTRFKVRPKTSFGQRSRPVVVPSTSSSSASSSSKSSSRSAITHIHDTHRQGHSNSQQQTESSASSKDGIGSGIFVKVDTIRDGQCFGLDSLFEDGDTPNKAYSLVSQGCELIHIPLSKFKELADDACLKQIKAKVRKYPLDDDLCLKFLEKSRWDSYKKEMIESVVAEYQNPVMFENSLRNTKRMEYLRETTESVVPQLRGRSYAWTTWSPSALVDVPPFSGSVSQSPHQRPHTAAARTKSQPRSLSVAGSTLRHQTAKTPTQDIISSPPKTTRPRTCPGRVRRSKTPSKYSSESQSGSLVTTTFITKKGYQVQSTKLFASNSEKTLQLVQTVRSPSHENRLSMIRMK